MQNIVLIGFMGCGKSTTARRLSKIIKKEIIDTDLLIQKRMQMSIKDIFERFGEDYFRQLECDLRDELAKKTDLIISCGGGFARLENLQKMGFVVFLDLSFFKIKSRLKNDNKRPLFDEKAKQLYDARIPLYHKNCHIKISVLGLKARQLAKILELFLKVNLTNDLRKAYIKAPIKQRKSAKTSKIQLNKHKLN